MGRNEDMWPWVWDDRAGSTEPPLTIPERARQAEGNPNAPLADHPSRYEDWQYEVYAWRRVAARWMFANWVLVEHMESRDRDRDLMLRALRCSLRWLHGLSSVDSMSPARRFVQRSWSRGNYRKVALECLTPDPQSLAWLCQITPLWIQRASVGPIPWAWLMRYDEDVAMHLLPDRVARGEVSASNHLAYLSRFVWDHSDTVYVKDLYRAYHAGHRETALVLLDEARARGVI